MPTIQESLRNLPKIDEMLSDERLVFLIEEASHEVVKQALQEKVAEAREALRSGARTEVPQADELVSALLAEKAQKTPFHLRRVVNATGVVNHTNLGRAVLSQRALAHVAELAGHYSNLEYNLDQGKRGSRYDHVEEILKQVSSAEAAMVVNNNAAAVILALSTLAHGKEAILSRGEMVEIGGSFRIPEIMEQSGVHLHEIGTTNRTWLRDYRAAVNENTGLYLKVHTSNYFIGGFTHETRLEELKALQKEAGYAYPIVYDMGSGLFDSLEEVGIREQTVEDALQAGADLVTFSGDKLLGGAQAGFLVGKRAIIEACKRHPLTRAFRVDKMTLAAVEATLYEYLDRKKARQEIPSLRMIRMGKEEARTRADHLAAELTASLTKGGWRFFPVPLDDAVGGGAAPNSTLPGYGVAIEGPPADQLQAFLHQVRVPILGRIYQDAFCLSVRTLLEGDEEDLVAGLEAAQEALCKM